MSPLLSNLLNIIGRFRFSFGPPRAHVIVGNPNAPDALASIDWKRFATPESLFDVWAPPADSPWTPYHCVPLFAALQKMKRDTFGPTAEDAALQIEQGTVLEAARHLTPLGEKWAAQRAWVILDVPGEQAVPLAARFIAGGFQPICTFDHWPHARGLLKPELILSQLLRYASGVSNLRQYLRPDSAPLWICDYNRLGTRRGNPSEFDNRYFLDDSILPSSQTLKDNGITHIICLVPTPDHMPREDLRAYFRDLRKEGVAGIDGAAMSDANLTLFEFPEKTFAVKFSQSGYVRSNAGGFGRLVPEPSSSSG